MNPASGAHPASNIAPNRIGERTEGVLLAVVYGCAVLLVFAPVGERTYLKDCGRLWALLRHDAYDFLAFLLEIVALVGLSWADDGVVAPPGGQVVLPTDSQPPVITDPEVQPIVPPGPEKRHKRGRKRRR